MRLLSSIMGGEGILREKESHMTKILLFLVYDHRRVKAREGGGGTDVWRRVSRRGTLDEKKKVKSCSSANLQGRGLELELSLGANSISLTLA